MNEISTSAFYLVNLDQWEVIDLRLFRHWSYNLNDPMAAHGPAMLLGYLTEITGPDSDFGRVNPLMDDFLANVPQPPEPAPVRPSASVRRRILPGAWAGDRVATLKFSERGFDGMPESVKNAIQDSFPHLPESLANTSLAEMLDVPLAPAISDITERMLFSLLADEALWKITTLATLYSSPGHQDTVSRPDWFLSWVNWHVVSQEMVNFIIQRYRLPSKEASVLFELLEVQDHTDRVDMTAVARNWPPKVLSELERRGYIRQPVDAAGAEKNGTVWWIIPPPRV